MPKVAPNKFEILKSPDFLIVAIETGYAENYVRQVLRGNVDVTTRSQKIVDSAQLILDNKIEKLNGSKSK